LPFWGLNRNQRGPPSSSRQPGWKLLEETDSLCGSRAYADMRAPLCIWAPAPALHLGQPVKLSGHVQQRLPRWITCDGQCPGHVRPRAGEQGGGSCAALAVRGRAGAMPSGRALQSRRRAQRVEDARTPRPCHGACAPRRLAAAASPAGVAALEDVDRVPRVRIAAGGSRPEAVLHHHAHLLRQRRCACPMTRPCAARRAANTARQPPTSAISTRWCSPTSSSDGGCSRARQPSCARGPTSTA
jgi:hypothetical protein